MKCVTFKNYVCQIFSEHDTQTPVSKELPHTRSLLPVNVSLTFLSDDVNQDVDHNERSSPSNPSTTDRGSDGEGDEKE